MRDPEHYANLALLTCRGFANSEPVAHQTWRVLLGANGARAVCELPRRMIDFNRAAFVADPRIASMKWER